MKTIIMALAALTVLPSISLADSADSGKLATGEEYVFRFASSTGSKNCNPFEGPSVIEAFKKRGEGAKVAEFTYLSKLELCKRGASYIFRSVGFSAKNVKRYFVEGVKFRFVVKDKNGRRIGGTVGTRQTYSTACSSKEQTMSPLSGTVTAKQFDLGRSVHLYISAGDWDRCRS